MPTIKSFLTLDESLAGRLKPAWRKMSKNLVARLATDIKKGDLTAATRQVNNIDLSSVCKGQAKFLTFMGTNAVLFGASRLTPEISETSVAKGKKVPDIVSPAMKQFKLILKEAEKTLKKEAFKAIELAEDILRDKEDAKFKTSKSEKVQKAQSKERILLKDVMDEHISKSGESLIDVAASLQMSRLAGYGYLVEAQFLGVTTYKINEQLDRRTCLVCQTMHGKTFEVSTAFTKVDTILRTEDPTELRAIAPWPKQDKASVQKLRGMGVGDMVAAGWNTPPFHPRCRGLLDISSSVEAITQIGSDVTGSIMQTVSDSVLTANVGTALKVFAANSGTTIEVNRLLDLGDVPSALFLLSLDANGVPVD